MKILRRISRGARQQCLLKCCAILDEVVNINSVATWEHLLHFPTHCLQVPLHSRGHSSLATRVKNQLNDEADPVPSQTKRERANGHRCTEDALQGFSRRVASKLEEGDFRGAVRLACSDNRLAPSDSATFAALQAKHPSPHCDKVIPPSPLPQTLQVETGAVIHAIRSFPSRSVGGPDCLHQHLKDILQVAGDESSIFSQSLASFCALVLEGRMLDALRPFLFGVSLVALEKSGGMRSIAVGCTLRRLLAKIAGQMVVDGLYMGSDGVRGEVEAAVHATRKYLMNLPRGHALLKVDFKNAFNFVWQDKMLEAVQELAPDICPLVHSAYSSSSSLLWGDKIIQSEEGVEQEDPLGPLLFCLTLHHHCRQLHSPLGVMYLDDVSLGGSVEDVLHDLDIIKAAEELRAVFEQL